MSRTRLTPRTRWTRDSRGGCGRCRQQRRHRRGRGGLELQAHAVPCHRHQRIRVAVGISKSLTHAADAGARVANISFRYSSSLTVSNAAYYFQQKGGVVTIAAGNEDVFDASPDNPVVLTVSATDSDDALACFSNTGNNIDVSAPGKA